MASELTAPENGDVELSVVIVTQDDEDRVRACIQSVLAACESVSEYEVILVDRASTDATVQRASEYPITVLEIPEGRLATTGAAQCVGTRAANGAQLLFVEGPMAVTERWLSRAMMVLDQETVAAVDGQLGTPAGNVGLQEVDTVRTVALYDRRALRDAGGFGPHLRSMPAVLLGFRLRAAGYRLCRLPGVAGTDAGGVTRESLPWRRWPDLAVGTGQVLRRSLDSRQLLWLAAKRFRYRLGAVAWLVVGLLTLVFAQVAVLGWLVSSTVMAGVVLSRYGPLVGLRYIAQSVVCVLGISVRFCLSPRPPDAFPLDTVVVHRDGPQYIRLIPCASPTPHGVS